MKGLKILFSENTDSTGSFVKGLVVSEVFVEDNTAKVVIQQEGNRHPIIRSVKYLRFSDAN